MRGFGGLLTFYGFASLVLFYLDRHYILLAWADDWQPWFGLVVGCAGAVALGISLFTHKEPEESPAPQGNPAQPFGPPPMGAPQPYAPPQQYGPPPGPQQYGPGPAPHGQPPYGPPQQFGPPQSFGPQGGPPYGPRG